MKYYHFLDRVNIDDFDNYHSLNNEDQCKIIVLLCQVRHKYEVFIIGR